MKIHSFGVIPIMLFYGMKSYPEAQKENPWGSILFFRLLSIMSPWEKLLNCIVAPLTAKDRIRTGIYYSLFLLVLWKILNVNRTWITRSIQTLG